VSALKLRASARNAHNWTLQSPACLSRQKPAPLDRSDVCAGERLRARRIIELADKQFADATRLSDLDADAGGELLLVPDRAPTSQILM